MQYRERAPARAILCLVFVVSFIVGFRNNADARTLHVGLLREPQSLNFFGATDIWSKKILRFFHMPLYIQGPHGGEAIPWLAESPPRISEEGDQIAIRLRQAKWHDGSQVTAHDLVFTVGVIQKFKIPGHVEKWQMVKNAEPLDSRTVRFTLDGPSSIFLNRTLFTSFVQAKEWAPVIRSFESRRNPLKGIMGFKPRSVASNGPFFMASRQGQLFIRLERNPHFFAAGRTVGKLRIGPHLQSIFFDIYYNVTTASIALEGNDIDFLWWNLPQDRVDELRRNAGVVVHETVMNGYDYLGFNLERSPFNDRAFRNAVALLVDRDRLVRELFNGHATPAYSVIPPGNEYWHNPGVQKPGKGLSWEERLDRAKAKLEEAGYSWSEGVLQLPGGRKMQPMEIMTNCVGSKPCRMKAAVLTKRWLSMIGIPVALKMLPFHEMLSLVRENAFDAYIMGWGHLSDDPGYLSSFFHSREAVPEGKNHPRFRSALFDELADRSSRETNLSKRRELVFRMQELIASESPCIPLYTRNNVEAVRNDLFEGWIEMSCGVGNLWSYLNLRPVQ